jgi:hypothetical protein
VCPKALAAVDEDFGLGTDGHKKYGGGENQAVGFNHLRGEYLIIIIDFAFARIETEVAMGAGCDVEFTQPDVLRFCGCRLCPGQGLAQKQITVALKSWACGDTEHFDAHTGTSFIYEQKVTAAFGLQKALFD